MTVAVGLKDILWILCILSAGEEEDRMSGWTGWVGRRRWVAESHPVGHKI
jgi:hypothetical protein